MRQIYLMERSTELTVAEPTFNVTSQEEMSQVLDAMFEKFCVDGEHIIDQDDDGDNFYVIER